MAGNIFEEITRSASYYGITRNRGETLRAAMAAQAQFSTVQRVSFALSLNGGAAALAAGMMALRIAPVSGRILRPAVRSFYPKRRQPKSGSAPAPKS